MQRMDAFRYERRYRGPLRAVVLDGAGTIADYGSRAPAMVFVEVFRREGAHWLLVATHGGEAPVRAGPFEAIELELEALWLPGVGEPKPLWIRTARSLCPRSGVRPVVHWRRYPWPDASGRYSRPLPSRDRKPPCARPPCSSSPPAARAREGCAGANTARKSAGPWRPDSHGPTSGKPGVVQLRRQQTCTLE
jgi:hypothetical protein